MEQFMSGNIDLIYFIYSESFLFLAALSFLLLKLNKEIELWRWSFLASIFFAASLLVHIVLPHHGVVWSHCVVYQLITLSLAFLSIMEYARRETVKRLGRRPYLGYWMYGPLLAVVVLLSWGTGSLAGTELVIRYLLGFSGFMWTALVLLLWRQKDNNEKETTQRVLMVIGILTVIFGLLLTVGAQTKFFPGNYVNEETFHRAFGFSVYLPRTIIVMIFSFTLLFSFDLAKMKLRPKINTAIVFFGLILASYMITVSMGRVQEDFLKRSLISRTKTAAAAINPERLKNLAGSTNDITSPDFKRIREQLVQIRGASTDTRFVYIAGLRQGKIFFYADAEPEDSPDYSEPGSGWIKYPPRLLNVFSYGTEAIEKYEDEWGSWVSGFASIKDPKSDVVLAILGMDINSGSWDAMVTSNRLVGIGISFGIYLFFMIMFIIANLKRISTREIAEVQQRFQTVFNYSPDVKFITKLDTGSIVEINKMFEDTFGYKREDVIGRTTSELSLYVKDEERRKIIEQLLSSGYFHGSEISFRTKDGASKTMLFTATLISIEDDRFILASLEDLSSYKSLASSLMKSEEKFYKIFHSSPIINTLTTLKEGRAMDVNESMIRSLGFNDKSEIIGKTVFELGIYKDPKAREQIGKQLLAKGFVRDVDVTFIKGNGEELDGLYSASLMELGGEKVILSSVVDITRRKKIEKQLKKSEERYRELVELAQEGIWSIDENYITTFVNPHLMRVFGYTEEELLGKPIFSFMDKQGHEGMTKKFESAIQTGSLNDDIEFIRKGGSKIILHFETTPIRDENGINRGFMSLITDVMEKRRTEKELTLLSMAVGQALEGFVICDMEGNIQYVNPSLAKMHGYEQRELIGQNYSMLHTKEDWHGTVQQLFQSAVNKGTCEAETYHVRRDGQRFPAYVTGSVLKDEHGAPLSILCMTTDITERKVSEKALKEKQEFLSLIIDATNDGIFDWDVATEHLYYSPRFKKILGFEDKELENNIYTWKKLAHPDDVPLIENEIRKCSEGQKGYTIEHRLQCKSGRYKWILIKAKAVHDEDGKFIRLVGSMTDIDETKRLIIDLTKAREEVSRISRIKDEFLSITSHDLKSPLGIVKTSMNLLLEEPTLTEPVKEYANLSLRQAEKGLKLISDLLDLKRLEAGEVHLEFTKFSIDKLIREVMEDYSIALEQSKIRCSLSLDAEYEVTADYGKLGQVLSNLVSNAIKHTHQGGEININATKDGGYLKISVSDTGEGIPPEKVQQIFQKYAQARPTDKRSGTGIGLTIAKYICNLHGGEIWAESSIGRGSTFSFRIPNVSVARTVDRRDEQRSSAVVNRKILIVDDIVDDRILAKGILEKGGYQIMEASSWKEGLDKMRSESLDLVLLDVEMPEMNGWEILEIIRREKSKKDLPVIIYTGRSDTEDKFNQYGANDIVKKEDSVKSLLKKVRNLIG